MKVKDCPFFHRLVKIDDLSDNFTMSTHKPEYDHDLMRDSETGILYVDYSWSTAKKSIHDILTLEEVRVRDSQVHGLAIGAARSAGLLD